MAEHVAYEPKTDTEINGMDFKALGGFVEAKAREMTTQYTEDTFKSAGPEIIKDFKAREKELGLARSRFSDLRTAQKSFQTARDQYVKDFRTANRGGLPFAGAGGGPNGEGDERAGKSMGQLFVESEPYAALAEKDWEAKSWSARISGNIRSEIDGVTVKSCETEALKATMTSAAGWVPYPSLAPRPPVMTALQMPVVADLIPTDDTTQPAILYYEETTFSDNAASVAEGGAKPEASLALTLRTQPVIKIAVTLPITDEQLQDVPQVRGYIDNRLTLMVKRAEDVQLLSGTGVPPQLQGFHTKAGIGSIARAANEDNADAFLRAITDVNSIAGFANTSGIVMHPLQWLAIRLIRTTTGEYIWGHPALQGPATLWGLPVVATAAETAGKGLVGDFQMYAHISRRMGIRIDVGYINDDFKLDIQRIRLEERLSQEIYRAAAFEEITNLN